MNQLPLFEPPSWSVSDLTRYLRELLLSDIRLQDIWVLGEISNLSRPTSGHIYFTLKDSSATLRCVMWRSIVQTQKWLPQEGGAVEVHGNIDVYEAGGQYQLYADIIRPVGEGALYQEFLRLKTQLEAEGLFDPARKRPIPRWPQRIGIVTSPTGAALRDILNTIRRRYPVVEVILATTAVQGYDAPEGIVAALKSLDRFANPDIILVARGGGSIEDLWAFNDERVARAIIATLVPVITGIGHETDFTIADFASDLRAPTPTAAAELATPNQDDLIASLDDLTSRMTHFLQSMLAYKRATLNNLEKRAQLKSPGMRIRTDRQRLDELQRRSSLALGHYLELQGALLNGLNQRLASLDPSTIMGRGYAMVSHADGRIIRSVTQVHSKELINIQVADGKFSAKTN